MEFKGTVPLVAVKPKTVDYMGNNGHWDFPEQMGDKSFVGFVYVIYDKVLDRAYLGKKQFRGTGQLNKGEESNWKKYGSSSPVLKEHFKERPKHEFEFICLEQYKAKGALSYAETWSLSYVEAPTTSNWYNTIIEKVSWSVKEGITDRHKERLNKVVERIKNAQKR
jgi:hypothetical protein